MKKFQIKFKTLLLLLVVGLAFTSCSKEDDSTDPDPQGNKPPIILDCTYFQENPNAVLQDDLDAPIDYIVTCMMTIDGNLIIEPGVVIAFEQDAGLNFRPQSSFKMNGTADKPIILTGVEATKGFWSGVITYSTHTDNLMRYVTIDYAGGQPLPGHSQDAALGIWGENTPLTMENCTISNSKNKGMMVSAFYALDQQNVFISNCTFTKNDIPLTTNASNLRMFNSTNSFAGNDKDYVFLDGGNIYGDATWAKLDVPYLMKSSQVNGFSAIDGVLTIEPGTEIIMTAKSTMNIRYTAALIMVGTAAEPITIRGEQQVPGHWNQIQISSESTLNEIGYVNIKHAGIPTGYPNGAVHLEHSKSLKIHDVTFSDCYEYGVSLEYERAAPLFNLEYSNLTLDNTPKLFSDWDGAEIIP